ncbi:MAG: tetratricopeptide repeat protein [Patescibacteria group bacterium]|nr:tetratricopeptide repeat protein [Patescibacteria group bacterium]MDE1944428.1 tetratricopeptide repeat protein [Patescibacteria group bacterium]MDE1944682.1 tetratricopeptide repeat protein [Patescibacteria group bacterium]MDE2057368.1 tetratricopeptide repeat protein [Patescibacteria group bacterium]
MRIRKKGIALALVCGMFAISLGAYPFWSAVPARFAWAHGYHAAAYYLNHTDANLALEEGHYYFGVGAYDLGKAAGAFKLALRLDPAALLAHYELGRIYYVEGNLAAAYREMNAELTANPGDFRAFYERGLIDASQGDLSSAEADFKIFIPHAPAEWGGYNDLAFVLAQEGRYAESEAVAREGMQKVPGGADIPWLWNSLGLAQLNALQYEGARASFEQALALANHLTTAEWQRAYSANDPTAAKQSIANFQNAIRANLSMAQAGSTP